MTRDATVVDEAVSAAWETCRLLDNQTSTEQRHQAQQRLQAAMDMYGCDEVARGTVFLVGALAAYLTQEAGQPGSLDPLSDLIPGVIRRLSRFEMADPAQAPMAAAVLTAAVLGQDTVAWRDQFGPLPRAEVLTHSFVLWLLADLLDVCAERPGTANEIMQATFESLANAPGTGG
ncbi:hypothetical protein ACFWAZ_38900 [Streptomyces collinus]|uniref:hypothetical protein n=1 Tax=Streptomyces collinus TaxID=42684 RepID=UPI003645F7B6